MQAGTEGWGEGGREGGREGVPDLPANLVAVGLFPFPHLRDEVLSAEVVSEEGREGGRE